MGCGGLWSDMLKGDLQGDVAEIHTFDCMRVLYKTGTVVAEKENSCCVVGVVPQLDRFSLASPEVMDSKVGGLTFAHPDLLRKPGRRER